MCGNVVATYNWLHHHVSVEGWAALAGWGTASIALIAAVVGLYQLNEMRRTRERQVQPYVVVYTELDPDDWQLLDLIIENVGQTPAYRVQPDLSPLTITPFVNDETGKEETVLPIPDEIGVLAPGQKWRTFWDSAPAREDDRKQQATDWVPTSKARSASRTAPTVPIPSRSSWIGTHSATLAVRSAVLKRPPRGSSESRIAAPAEVFRPPGRHRRDLAVSETTCHDVTNTQGCLVRVLVFPDPEAHPASFVAVHVSCPGVSAMGSSQSSGGTILASIPVCSARR
jgi:hypothetical protein